MFCFIIYASRQNMLRWVKQHLRWNASNHKNSTLSIIDSICNPSLLFYRYLANFVRKCLISTHEEIMLSVSVDMNNFLLPDCSLSYDILNDDDNLFSINIISYFWYLRTTFGVSISIWMFCTSLPSEYSSTKKLHRS